MSKVCQVFRLTNCFKRMTLRIGFFLLIGIE